MDLKINEKELYTDYILEKFPTTGHRIWNENMKKVLLEKTDGDYEKIIGTLMQWLIAMYEGETFAMRGGMSGTEILAREENKRLREHVYRLQQKLYLCEKENEEQELRETKQKKEIEVYKKTLREVNGHYAQRMSVKNGKKLRYKEEVSVEEVQELLESGMTITAIAKKFGVSRPLIYRRKKEIENKRE